MQQVHHGGFYGILTTNSATAEGRMLNVIDGGANGSIGATSTVTQFDEAAARAKDLRLLRTQAATLEAWYGPNAYSTFLCKHGCRPEPEQAATIGRLLGGRVRANDGTMQPPLTKADRQVLNGIKARRKAASSHYDHILRLRDALAALSQNEANPAEIISRGSCLLNEATISAQLDIAVGWLSRFAREWHEQKRARARNPDSAQLDQGKLAKKGVTSAELVEAILKHHRKMISAEQDDLNHIALMKLAAEACDGRTGVETTAQLELFTEYAVPKMVTVRRKDAEGRLQSVHIALGALTIPQLREHVAEIAQKAYSKSDEELKELARLADEMEEFKETPSSTVDECWVRYKEASEG